MMKWLNLVVLCLSRVSRLSRLSVSVNVSLCLCLFVLAVHGRDHVSTTTSSCLRQETADPFGGCPEGGGRERGEARQSVVVAFFLIYLFVVFLSFLFIYLFIFHLRVP